MLAVTKLKSRNDAVWRLSLLRHDWCHNVSDFDVNLVTVSTFALYYYTGCMRVTCPLSAFGGSTRPCFYAEYVTSSLQFILSGSLSERVYIGMQVACTSSSFSINYRSYNCTCRYLTTYSLTVSTPPSPSWHFGDIGQRWVHPLIRHHYIKRAESLHSWFSIATSCCWFEPPDPWNPCIQSLPT